MSMHGGGGGGPAIRMGMRSLSRDRKILEHRIKKGTFPRILKFARAYKRMLIIFLIAVVLDSVVSSVSPLLLRAIFDNAIPEHNRGFIVWLATLTAILAIFDAGLSLTERGSRPSSAKD
jgi:ATP-binding cassette subfamily B protein